MVVKFFGNKKGGSTASVDYLLNERQEAKTARTLQGDANLTKELIRSIERKQKVCVGCLSFEEANIPEADKYKLMAEFEKTMLPDMQGRYNILWVEHTDKGRLELNFVVPRVELETGKGLSPYYHFADAKTMRLFQEVHNLENGWSNPQDPSKARTLEGASKKIELQRDYEQLDTLLHNLVQDGKIQNRTQLIETLEASKINVTRQSKDSISVKLPDSLKARKLKGGIYAEQFTSLRSIETISEQARARVTEYHQRDTHKELTRAKQELDECVRYKAEWFRKQYPKELTQERTEPNQNKELDNHNLDRPRNYDHNHTIDMVTQTERGRSADRSTDTIQRDRQSQANTGEQERTRTEREIIEGNSSQREQNQTLTSREQGTQSVEHTRPQSWNDTRWQEVDANERSHEGREWQELGISREITGAESENKIIFRTDARRRTREREKAQQFSLTAIREEPNGVHQRVTENIESIRGYMPTNEARLRADTQRRISEKQPLIRELHTERSSGISVIKERVGAFIQGVKEYIAEKARASMKAFTDMHQKALSKEQIKQAFEKVQEKEQTQKRSHGHSLSR